MRPSRPTSAAAAATARLRSIGLLAGRPVLGGTAIGLALLATPVASAPLGRLGPPFALLIVLPPLALALEAFGWRDLVAAGLGRVEPRRGRIAATYAAWLLVSALLTLDVAAVAAASIGVAVARGRAEERRWQLGGAILGANVGSLLSRRTGRARRRPAGRHGALASSTGNWPRRAGLRPRRRRGARRARQQPAGRGVRRRLVEPGAPAPIVAFLIGTNVTAIATPHGSVATILARATGARQGVEIPAVSYLRSAWRYGLAGTLAALAALALVAR